MLILAALVGVAACLLRRWRRSTRRRTLLELRRLRAEFQAGLDSRQAIDRVAGLLRRTLISYRGREGFAGSSGERWLAQLRELGPVDEQLLGWLAEGRYRTDRSCDVMQLLDACEAWLGSLPRESRRVSA